MLWPTWIINEIDDVAIDIRLLATDGDPINRIVVFALLDLVSPCMFIDSTRGVIMQGVAWPRDRNGTQTLCSQTRYPTAVSTRKRGCVTFSYLGDAGSPPPEVLSLLDIKDSFDGYSWLFVDLLRLSIWRPTTTNRGRSGTNGLA